MVESLFLIDVSSLIFQVFHAIRQPMTGSQGQPTNAVFGFTRDLRNIIRDHKPTYLICALDSSGPGTRSEIYAEYKANRSAMPEDLRPQLPLVNEVIRGHRVPAIKHDGWEADDVIATFTRQGVERGMQVVVVTGDKDIRQLLSPQVRILNIRKGEYLDEKFLLEDWGVRPDQVIDFQSMVGDAVDNIPGIPLVGPKKASALLEKFGTLEEVIAHADEAPGKKLQENIKNFAEQALMSRKLVTLNQHLPLEIDWEEARVSDPDHEILLELFDRLAFRSLADEMRSKVAGAVQKTRSWKVINTPDRFEKFVDRLRKQKRFCMDLETTSLNTMQADIVGWAFSWTPHESFYIPVLSPAGQPALDPATVLAALKPILESSEVEIINQNIKYDMLVLMRVGVRIRNVGMDPMVGHYLLDAGARSHGLDALAAKYLHHQMIPISKLIGTGKKQKKMFEVDVIDAAEYASEDADIAFQLANLITDELKKENLFDLYWNLERPLIPVLAEMEHAGIRVDVKELQRQSEQLTTRLEELIKEIHEIAGHEFNIDSPKQLQVVLFEELKLPVQRKTKTGASTDQEVLEQLALLHPLPNKIMEHRHLSKLKGTYLDALPQMVDPDTGNIHTSFNQVVAATGRLSSNDPNLQNIPIRTEEGRQIRRAFIPSKPGWKLVCADYSQIELRMLAHFSRDEGMVAAFQQGIDIHTAVASQVFGVPTEQVNSDQRRIAKTVNFGVIYGQSAFGLSAVLGIEKDVAGKFIEAYFERYRGAKEFFDRTLVECRKLGYASSIMGRRRAIEGIREEFTSQRTLPERTAINMVIQGSAADLIKQAMINVFQAMKSANHPAKMLLQIHDELVFESPESHVDSLVKLVRQEMETALELSVPLVVDVSVGINWLDRQKM